MELKRLSEMMPEEGENHTMEPLSMIDFDSGVDKMLKGGLGRFYEKMNHHHQKQYSLECQFRNLEMKANVKVRDPETMFTWLKSPFRPCGKLRGKNGTEQRTILYPMSGTIPAGSLTLLLGGPRSGKTTLLKTLSGTIPNSCKNNNESFVWLNGMDVHQVFQRSRCIGMVPQNDDHHPTMTVQETLEFARVCHVGKDATSKLLQMRTELIMKILGIDHVKDTIVGSAAAGLRGVSGGQRKRVTIGECLVGDQGFVLMDEMNTGLDSQSTFEVVQAMRTWCNVLGGTSVISMLQPQNDVMEQFDRIILLNAGRLVYCGPMDHVVAHFERFGLSRPDHVDLADWLLNSICGHGDPDALAAHYQASEFCTCFEMDHDIQEDNQLTVKSEVLHSMHLEQIDISNKNPFVLSFTEDLMEQLKRSWTLCIRNRMLNMSILTEALLVSLLLGCGFFYTNDAQMVMSLLFAIASLLVRQAWQVIPIVLNDKGIFYKQRMLNMHRTSTFVIAQACSQLPINIMAIFLLTTPLYFLVNLAGSEFVRFLATFVLLFLLQQALRAWMTFFAALAPNSNVAQAISAVFVILSLMFSGFIMLEGLIPDWAIWLYWISPVSWGMRALAQIEFLSPFWENLDDGYPGNSGIRALETYQLSTDPMYIIYGAIVLIGYFFLFAIVLTTVAFHFVRPAQNYVFRLVNDGGRSAKSEQIEIDLLIPEDCARDNDGEIVKCEMLEDEHQCVVPVEADAQNQEKCLPVTLTIRNLRYSVQQGKGGESIELLQGVSAQFKPGTITALMGSSGAGKTTLMDVIAGRKSLSGGNQISGEILVNGKQMDKSTFARIVGYCEQFDTQSPNMTVWESLLFSARLRRDLSQSKVSHHDWCEEIISLLEMKDIVNARIGQHPTGLSIEQRKRLSIAQELAGNPSVIFLDEPTSGLDQTAAVLVVSTIKKVASMGRTILCTIHQPSIKVFGLFDELLLLQKGGQVVFFGKLGTNCEHLLNYFHGIPHTPICEVHKNPANYMLRLIGQNESNLIDYHKAYLASNLYEQTSQEIDRFVREKANTKTEQLQLLPYATGNVTQFQACVARMWKVYYRSPEYTLIRLLLSVVIGIFLGGMYFQFGVETTDNTRSQIGIIYLAMDILGILSMVLVTPFAFRERAVFYRETASSYYRPIMFPLAMLLIEIPFITLTVAFYVIPSYWMIGLDPNPAAFLTFFLFWLGYITMTTFEAIAFGFLLPTAAISQVFIGILTGVFNIFSGFLLARKVIPDPLLLFYYVNTDTYPLNALNSIAFASCPYSTEQVLANPSLQKESLSCSLTFDPVFNYTITVNDFVVESYSFNPNRTTTDGCIIAVFISIFAIVALLSAQFIRHIKR